jgi:hypothetical protein
MKFLLSLLIGIASWDSYAEEMISRIYDIDYGQGEGPTLILMDSGHVIRVASDKNTFVKKDWLKIYLDKDNKVSHYLPSEAPFLKKTSFNSFNEEQYSPSLVSDSEQAKYLFKESRYKSKESQCFNRAHVWSHEWYKNHGILSNKTWLFFTRKYIRKYAFDWWFHVAPSILVSEDGMVREKIMDRKYGRGPQNLNHWTDIFVRNNANCPVVQKYSDYANYPETGWCYTMRTSMFYYQPVDIEWLELWELQKSNWHEEELRAAYKDALDLTEEQ